MPNILDYAAKLGIQPKRVASTHGGEYASPCPGCGGEDRFRIWPDQKDGDGSFWCRQCDKKGDVITFLIEFFNMTFPEACREIGRPLPQSSRIHRPLQRNKKSTWQPARADHPKDMDVAKWQEKARKVADWAHEKLLEHPKQIAWLADRGIQKAAIEKFRLGWIPENLFRPRESWGLPTLKKENGKPRRLIIPAGLVIPLELDECTRRLRIRRIDGEPKYYVMPGSAMMPMVVNPGKKVFVVVETELDGMLIGHRFGDIAGAVSLGSCSSKPDVAAEKVLKRALHILVALDFDRAGANAWRWWQENYSQAERWPVPEGKDPGEAFEKGVDLKAWILAGLPPSFLIGRSPLDEKKEGRSDINIEAQAAERAPDPLYELYEYLEKCPVKIRATNHRVTLIEDEAWASKNWGLSRKISHLVYFESEVFKYLQNHPDMVINATNFWIKKQQGGGKWNLSK